MIGRPSVRIRGPPSFFPLRFAAAKAARVRAEIMPASNSATATICCNKNRPVAPSISGRSANLTSTFASSKRPKERHTASKAVNFADDQWATVEACSTERFLKFWPIGPATALNFRELSDNPPATTIEVSRNGRLLGLKPQPASALAIGRDAVIGDKLPARDQVVSSGSAYYGSTLQDLTQEAFK
jgi:hypothetical protein